MAKTAVLSHFYAQPNQGHLRVVLDITITAEGETATIQRDMTLNDAPVMAALDNLERAILAATGATRPARPTPPG